MPRFRDRIKEYAFIEFQSKKSVRKAIDEYMQYGKVISNDTDPMDLMSTKSYMIDPLDYNYQDQDLDIPIHPMPSMTPIRPPKRCMSLVIPPKRDYDMPAISTKRYKSSEINYSMMPPQRNDWHSITDTRNPEYYNFTRGNFDHHIPHPSHAYQHSQQHPINAPSSHIIQQIIMQTTHHHPPHFYTDYTTGESSSKMYEQQQQQQPKNKVTQSSKIEDDDEYFDDGTDLQLTSSDDDDSNASSERFVLNPDSKPASDEENKIVIPKKIRKRRNAVDCKEPNPLHIFKIMKK